MIAHNPKQWLFWPSHFHRTDTLRRLAPWMLVVSLYAAFVAWLELEYWKIGENSHLRNISQIHSLLGFAISFTLVFRTNTAYERWWEGRKLWGTLVNNSRNLAMKLAAILPENDPERKFFRKIIPLYAAALKNHLRSEETRIELFDGLPQQVQDQLDRDKHLPNQIAAFMYRHIQKLRKEDKLTEQQLLFLNPELMSFTEVCGACERIKNTPIPYSYGVFIKKFLMVYIATLPFGFVFSLGYIVVPVVAFVFFVLASLELIAEEIEEPFGADENDLPLARLAHNIRIHVEEIL
jgi:ion channel-forming bestrophin family protein